MNSGFGGFYHTPSRLVATTSFPTGLNYKEDSAEVKDPGEEKVAKNAFVAQNAKPNEDTSGKPKTKGQSGAGDPFVQVATYQFNQSPSSSSSSSDSSEEEEASGEKKMKLDDNVEKARNKYKDSFNFKF